MESCSVCSSECNVSVGSVSCSLCHTWFHQSCINMSKQKYKFISSDNDLLWLCWVCRKLPWHFCVCGKVNVVTDPAHSCIRESKSDTKHSARRSPSVNMDT